MCWQDPITNSGCLTWNIESLFSLCWLNIVSFIHRVDGRTGDGVSIVLVRQSDGLLDFSGKGSICVLLYCVVSVLLEIPGEFRRGVWTGSESWAGYSDRLLLLQLTWDFNCWARRRICGIKSNTHFTLKNTVNVTDVEYMVFFKASTDIIALQLWFNRFWVLWTFIEMVTIRISNHRLVFLTFHHSWVYFVVFITYLISQ